MRYVAILGDNVILQFRSGNKKKDKEVNKRMRGKVYRIEDGKETIPTLEDWLIKRNKNSLKYKVIEDNEIMYFKTMDRALKKFTPKSQIISLSYQEELNGNMEIFEESIEDLNNYLEDNIENIKELYDNIPIINEKIRKEMSRLDLKVVDIEHAIEFQDLQRDKEIELYKLLRQTLIMRRKCKNAQAKIRLLNGCNLRNVDDVVSKLQSVENQKYRPRVLKELFK